MYHHLDTTKKRFIGKAIKNIAREDESTLLLQFTDGSTVRASVEGDCCSRSVFYEWSLPASAIGKAIIDMIEQDQNEDNIDAESVVFAKLKGAGIDLYQECSSIWNVVFKTAGGDITLRHINSSNGYYDGMTSYEDVLTPEQSENTAKLKLLEEAIAYLDNGIAKATEYSDALKERIRIVKKGLGD